MYECRVVTFIKCPLVQGLALERTAVELGGEIDHAGYFVKVCARTGHAPNSCDKLLQRVRCG